MSNIDLSPIVNQLVLLAAGILAVLVPTLIALVALYVKRLASKAGIEIADKDRALISSVLVKGWQAAEVEAAKTPGVNKLAFVVDYALRSVPDTLAKLGVDDTHLRDMAQARQVEAATAPAAKIEATVTQS